VKSGPDVFADALVPKAGAEYARRADLPNPQQLPAVLIRLSGWRDAIAPMVIALPNGRVNRIPRFRNNPRKTCIFAIPRALMVPARSHSIHRDT
jgi:hypothetical protein